MSVLSRPHKACSMESRASTASNLDVACCLIIAEYCCVAGPSDRRLSWLCMFLLSATPENGSKGRVQLVCSTSLAEAAPSSPSPDHASRMTATADNAGAARGHASAGRVADGAAVPHAKGAWGHSSAAEPILADLAEDLACPICMSQLRDPFVTSCGHSFCHACVSKHLAHRQELPQLRRIFDRRWHLPQLPAAEGATLPLH